MGAIIADGVKINSFSIVGAGSFVPFDQEIPPNSLVVGYPAGLAIYQDLTKRYLKSFREIPSEDVKKEDSGA
jgi:carbonic anhydrase/acetyltransferase-like protein (isoleucine patch superfamily)